MSVTGAIDPTRKMSRQDPVEQFARALGCRVDDLLLAGDPSHWRSLEMEFDLDAVTTAIAARRPPLEESVFRAQRAAIVPLSVLGTARQLVGKTTGRALAKLVIESTVAAWRRDAALASELRLPADAAARLQTLMSAARVTEDWMKVPEEQSCWRQLNQVLTGERVFDLAGAVELLNEGGTAAEVAELIVDTLDVPQSGMAAPPPAQIEIRPKVTESDDPEKALVERLELCAAYNPLRRRRCEGLKRELDKALGSSDPLPDHLFRQIANVFGDNGPAYVIWWLELLLARSLCHFVRQVAPLLQGGNLLLLADAVRTLKTGAAAPSVERLLQSFELPGVSMGSFDWANVALEISQRRGAFRFCIEFAHERENLMRREPIREAHAVRLVDPKENGRHDLSNNHALQRRRAQRPLPPAGLLKCRQPRLPLRDSGSTSAVAGMVSTEPCLQPALPPTPVRIR